MKVEELIKNAKESNANEMLSLLDDTLEILKEERDKKKALFYLPPESVVIVGDLHGDLESLHFILKDSEFIEKKSFLIFLGDYGDRGFYSPEVYHVILDLKRIFSKKVILLRGNHEFPEGLQVYPHDLPFMLKKKYGKEEREIYRKIKKLWNYLYVGAIEKEKYLFVHGGIPVNLNSLREISLADELHPSESFLEEILWNDPFEGKGYYPSPRGAGRLFGKDVTEKVLKVIGVKTLIRSHQPPVEGVKVNHDGLIFTLSSTKVYGGKAAYLNLDLSKKVKNAYELKNIVKIF